MPLANLILEDGAITHAMTRLAQPGDRGSVGRWLTSQVTRGQQQGTNPRTGEIVYDCPDCLAIARRQRGAIKILDVFPRSALDKVLHDTLPQPAAKVPEPVPVTTPQYARAGTGLPNPVRVTLPAATNAVEQAAEAVAATAIEQANTLVKEQAARTDWPRERLTTDAQDQEMLRRYRAGERVEAIATALNLNKGTAYRRIRIAAGLRPEQPTTDARETPMPTTTTNTPTASVSTGARTTPPPTTSKPYTPWPPEPPFIPSNHTPQPGEQVEVIGRTNIVPASASLGSEAAKRAVYGDNYWTERARVTTPQEPRVVAIADETIAEVTKAMTVTTLDEFLELVETGPAVFSGALFTVLLMPGGGEHPYYLLLDEEQVEKEAIGKATVRFVARLLAKAGPDKITGIMRS